MSNFLSIYGTIGKDRADLINFSTNSFSILKSKYLIYIKPIIFQLSDLVKELLEEIFFLKLHKLQTQSFLEAPQLNLMD